ncbi:MAG TPA: hypothetical protein VF412_19455 [Bdellovibrio sp.]|uniref:hypothetical protein n=1 Tax=Bdellovibrio sp. TaxID=28201 RepID=UPI002F1D8663
MSTMKYTASLVCASLIMGACQPKVDSSNSEVAQSLQKYLFVSSGACYSGSGVTAFSTTTSSNVVYKVNLSTGVREALVADYNSSPATPGDSPISIVDWDKHNLAVLVRNGNAGRLELLPKAGGTRGVFGTNPATSTILSTAPQSMAMSSDGGLLMIRTGFIEKVNSSGIRQTTPYVSNNLGATCGTANTLLTKVIVSPSGKIITASANASPKLISTASSGASGSCLAGQAPTGASYATAFAYDQTHNKVIVAWSGSTTAADVNSIVVYDYDDTAGTFSNAQKIYDANAYPATYSYLLFGVSAMTYDETDGQLYIATAISTATTAVNYAIEKFTYNPNMLGVDNTKVLMRAGNTPFYSYGLDTKCISSMLVTNDPLDTTN